jgi:hypothetical protein
MAGDVERKLQEKKHLIMDFPAIPNMDRDFIELISSKRFKDSVDKVRMAWETQEQFKEEMLLCN